MSATLSPFPKFRAFDANGSPLVGGKLYSYAAGTTTPLATYTDQSGSTPNVNPVILDANGEASVWLGNSVYKFVLTDSSDVTQWTVDNIAGDYLTASGTSQHVAGALGVKILNGSIYNVLEYGAKGDGSTNDSTAIQNAINAASAAGGGVVLLPPGIYKANVTLPNNVELTGADPTYPSYDAHPTDAPSQMLSGSAGVSAVISVDSGAQWWKVAKLYIRGYGSGTGDRGIYIPNGGRALIEDVALDNFGEEGVRWVAGGILTLSRVTTIACLLNRTRSAHSGTIYIGGDDGKAYDVEANASQQIEGAKISANLYVNALVVAGSNFRDFGGIYGFSDIGVYVASGSANSVFVNTRSEFNYGHGWYLDGSARCVACMADTNGIDTDNTYDNFHVGSGVNVQIVGSTAFFTSGWSTNPSNNQPRYGFYDAQASDANKNYYVGNKSQGHKTAAYSNAASSGAGITIPDAPALVIASGATPSVDQANSVVLDYAAPTTVTNFINGVNGQHLWIKATANVTFQHNGVTIFTANGADEPAEPYKFYHFIKNGAAWYEQGLPKNGVFGGSLTIGGGTTVKKISIVNSVAIDPGSIATVSRGYGTGTLTGAAVGDVVVPVALPGINDDLVFETAEVSAPDTVKVWFYNPTAGSIDDGSVNWSFLWFDLT